MNKKELLDRLEEQIRYIKILEEQNEDLKEKLSKSEEEYDELKKSNSSESSSTDDCDDANKPTKYNGNIAQTPMTDKELLDSLNIDFEEKVKKWEKEKCMTQGY